MTPDRHIANRADAAAERQSGFGVRVRVAWVRVRVAWVAWVRVRVRVAAHDDAGPPHRESRRRRCGETIGFGFGLGFVSHHTAHVALTRTRLGSGWVGVRVGVRLG